MIKKVKLLNTSGGESLNEVEYQLRYMVTTDDRLDGPFMARMAQPWRYGDPYVLGNEFDSRAKAKSVKESPVSAAHFTEWFVDVSFGDTDTEKDNSNPLNDMIEMEMSWQGQSRRTWIDADGKFLCNTAGELYTDGMEVEDNLPTMSYSINQAFFSQTLAMQVRNACNKTTWKGFPPRTVKLRSMTAARMFHRNIGVYYACKYAFSILTEEFALETPSVGYNEVTGSGTARKLKPIKQDGKIVTSPWPLDQKGKAQVAQFTNDVWTGTPLFMQKFPKHTQVEFNTVFGFL